MLKWIIRVIPLLLKSWYCTGNEVYSGRIKARFFDKLKPKLKSFCVILKRELFFQIIKKRLKID